MRTFLLAALVLTLFFAFPGSEERAYAAELTKTSALKSKMMTYSSTDMPKYTTYRVGAGGNVKVVPVKAATTGWMYLDLKTGTGNDGHVTIYFTDKYSYKKTQNKILLPDSAKGSFEKYEQGITDTEAFSLPVKEGRVYYAIFQSAGYSTNAGKVSIRAKCYSTKTTRVLTERSSYTLASGFNRSMDIATVWYKVKPKKTGVMAVSLKEYGRPSSSGSVKLYNHKKQARSETVRFYSSEKNIYFGVKKGRTYYVKVTRCYGTASEQYAFGVKYKMTSYKDRSLSSKSKAKKIWRKADTTNTLFVASKYKSTDWYKFKVVSKKDVRIALNTSRMTAGRVYVTFYKGKKKIAPTQTLENGYDVGASYTLPTKKKGKGTYYVKVTKSSNASGKYGIRYVK